MITGSIKKIPCHIWINKAMRRRRISNGGREGVVVMRRICTKEDEEGKEQDEG